MKKIFAIVIFLAILGFGISWKVTKNEKVADTITSFEECVKAGNPVMESYPRQCKDGDKNFVEVVLARFEDSKIGLSFKYPLKFGTVDLEIAGPGKRPGGETGSKLVGKFSNFSGLEFGGTTSDFTAGREGLLTDTRGFVKDGDKYYIVFMDGKKYEDNHIIPLKILKKDFGEILILDDKSFKSDREKMEGPVLGVGEGRLAGLVNLKGEKFSGIVFYDWDTEEFPLDEFESMLNSVEVGDVSDSNLIRVQSPMPNEVVSSPLVIKGEASGVWMFEGGFPISLTDWDGKIIAEGFATAKGEWMTKDFVPFEASLPFNVEKDIYSRKGTLILKKDNPTGLPEHDDSIEIPVIFKEEDISSGGSGILPFKSGISGQVLLGPVCPVVQNPPDPRCADKGYITTVEVFAKNSFNKDSPFSVGETDKEGNYKFMIPPGEYEIRAMGGKPFPTCQSKEVTVGPDEMVLADISCDTGIR